jgi:hypothetical protein
MTQTVRQKKSISFATVKQVLRGAHRAAERLALPQNDKMLQDVMTKSTSG